MTSTTGTLHSLKYLAEFFLESEVFQTNVVEKIKILCAKTFFPPKIVPCMAYCGNILSRRSLISRNSKLQIYSTLVRPVVTYGSESWTVTIEEERALAVFERKILLKIYGPVEENFLWRIRRNDELEAIIKGENIVRFIKCQII